MGRFRIIDSSLCGSINIDSRCGSDIYKTSRKDKKPKDIGHESGRDKKHDNINI